MIDEVDLEHYTNNCTFDTLKLYDGSSADSYELGTFCAGSMMTMSSGPSLFVVFESDSDIGNGRFALSWTFEDSG